MIDNMIIIYIASLSILITGALVSVLAVFDIIDKQSLLLSAPMIIIGATMFAYTKIRRKK